MTREKACRIIAVTSGKGGVGKSSVSASLALSLRSRGDRVLVIDADLGLADLNLAFSVRPEHTLLDVVAGTVTIEQAICEGPLGLSMLAAYAGDFDLANIDDIKRRNLLDAIEPLTKQFDAIVIDTGAGIGATTLGFAAIATDVLVVATRHPASLSDAYALMKVLAQRYKTNQAWLLPNMVDSAAEAQAIYASLETVVRRFLPLKLQFAGFICRDQAVPRGWQKGTPFVIDRPDSPASQCMQVLASTLSRAPVALQQTFGGHLQ